MNAKLLVVIGNTTKREVELQLPAVLGRSREADVTVVHPLISRRHCEISEDNGVLVLRDMASLNGTMIGGRRVEFAPLLPEAEFTIGPLTFRVLYEYDGDLEAVPETRFAEEVQEPAEAGLDDPAEAEEVPMLEVEDALPAEPAGELAMPDLMALADAEIEEILPAAAESPEQSPPVSPPGPLGPPPADDRLPTMSATDALDEPLEVDSSLQSGGPGKESPWAVDSWTAEELRRAPTASVEAELLAQPETPPESKTPVKKTAAKTKPPAANPTKRPNDGDEMDPEFGSFLEDLQ